MAISSEHRSIYAAIHLLWWRFQMTEKSRVWQTPNKQLPNFGHKMYIDGDDV